MSQASEYPNLYGQYLPRILHYIRLRVGDEDLAQDLTAEVFELAFARQQTLRHPEALGAWLFVIARRVVAGHYRQQRRTVSLERVHEQPCPDPSPPEVVIGQEEVAGLRAALARLPERDREVLMLKFAGCLGNQEIARVLKLRPGHVAVLLFRALHKLRRQMQGEGS